MQKQVPDNPVEKNRDIEGRSADFNPLVIITALMVCFYLAANLMAVRVMDIFGTALLDAGTIIFPLTYMLGNILAEVWGFKVARKVILLAFLCNVILMGGTALAAVIPYPAYLAETSEAYSMIFTYMPRIVAGSLCAFLVGELTNAWCMVKIRALTGHRFLWVRTIGSSAVGQIFDSMIFCIIAFGGTLPWGDLFVMIGTLYVTKVVIEAALCTPIAYAIIGRLRKTLP
ncbi:MAG: queuosine precursor transporter [Clostridiales bacterium]|nr:queuosine precursor transporter [Clostridiales bacterium]